MPFLTFKKSTLGAVVDVWVQPSARQAVAMHGPAKQPVQLKMLIDTGADFTAVDDALIAPWGLNPRTWHRSATLNGTSRVARHDCALTIMGTNGQAPWSIDGLFVSARHGSPFAGLPYAGLIGRDVLDQGMFVYSGASSEFMLAYS